MSRRPALKVGNLYYIKMKNVGVKKAATTVNSYSTSYEWEDEDHEYIAEIINLEPIEQKMCVMLSILASTQDVDVSEVKMASSQYRLANGTYQKPLTITYLGDFNQKGAYLWERAAFIQMKGSGPVWMSNAVIHKFNPRKLPLYLGWTFGKDWVTKQLQESK